MFRTATRTSAVNGRADRSSGTQRVERLPEPESAGPVSARRAPDLSGRGDHHSATAGDAVNAMIMSPFWSRSAQNALMITTAFSGATTPEERW
jgi:hypothetical protein